MSRRPDPDSPFWIRWRLPNGRSGKLGPFFGTAAASAAAEVVERQRSRSGRTRRAVHASRGIRQTSGGVSTLHVLCFRHSWP